MIIIKLFLTILTLQIRGLKTCFVEYHIEFFKSGITKIIKLWLKNGCRESPEDMVEILESEYQK